MPAFAVRAESWPGGGGFVFRPLLAFSHVSFRNQALKNTARNWRKRARSAGAAVGVLTAAVR